MNISFPPVRRVYPWSDGQVSTFTPRGWQPCDYLFDRNNLHKACHARFTNTSPANKKIISHAGLVGGGNWPHPGEISLAHRGGLFLDELSEFGRRVLEVLRQPIGDKVVTISRAQGSLTFPASFQLIAAMNPCPCSSN